MEMFFCTCHGLLENVNSRTVPRSTLLYNSLWLNTKTFLSVPFAREGIFSALSLSSYNNMLFYVVDVSFKVWKISLADVLYVSSK